MSDDVNADIRKAIRDAEEIEKAKKPISKVRRGKYNDLVRFCPGCMSILYRKKERCPNCGQMLIWKTK